MIARILSRALLVCFALGIYSVTTLAQTADSRPRLVKPTSKRWEPYVGTEKPARIPEAKTEAKTEAKNETPHVVAEAKPGAGLGLLTSGTIGLTKYQPLLSAAIDQRLGSPYSWGSTGPDRFDCSGFVWSTFHSAGIEFERGSARTLWARFEAPAPEETMKFGTLVFFSGRTHVGIVVDEHGFYHASRHHGVVYAPFNKYWLSKIDGFRRVPLAVTRPAAAPVATVQTVTNQ
jgi:cell wall-associated NlpC family hydrolase